VSISTPQDVINMIDDTIMADPQTTYTLSNNIDMSGYPMTQAIGDDTRPFAATFDGNFKSISNLRVQVTGGGANVYAGLFGVVGVGGVIKDLTVVDDSISGVATASVPVYAGLVARNGGTVTNVKVTGDVSVQGASGAVAFAGSLVGAGEDDTVSNSFVQGSVSGAGPSAVLGGVVGSGQGTRLSQVASLSTVEADTSILGRAGGIVGLVLNAAGRPTTITDSYAQGDVSITGTGTAYLGGIVGVSVGGSVTATRTYYAGAVSESSFPTANLGGLAGALANDDTISASYYSNANARDVGFGSGYSADDTALSLTAMQQIASYSTWPIVGTWQVPGANTWGICEGQSFPYLLRQASANPCVAALSVSGIAEVSQTLTASVTAADDISYRWGWLDGGVFTGILETNSPTYVVTSADIGHRMAVRVVSRSGTASATAYSAPTAVVPGPPPPPPTYPPSAPLDVSGAAGDASAVVSWSRPASAGSFPISSYQVRSIPASDGCLTADLTCEVTGLANGTAYSFEVRALNGAGWGPWSSASEPVIPALAQSIMITGSREGPVVKVVGQTTGLVGEQVTPWLRFPGPKPYAPGTGVRTVDAEGRFAWERQTGKKVYVYFAAGDVRSNRVIIRG
jgi:hypothetical protein